MRSVRDIAKVEQVPCEVDEIENVWIELPDGCRLAARLWLPRDARKKPVPALLEYLPYRKRDLTRSRDERIHPYFAGQGYACVRVDVRGSGDSDGLLVDEYSARELEDALEVLAWIAGQPWCDGGIGMFGKSWGGFNALQVAALAPPQLKAVISVCASDDRYADDAHYMGGCLLNENLVWGANLLAYAACPPDPQVSGEAWRKRWLERLEQMPLYPARWLRHQRRDDYWRHGSVCENYTAIRCPIFVIGGWADGYTNAVPRLLAGLRVPRKGLIGPWAHAYPHDGLPGPAIHFQQEAVRWWDHWLKGHDSGFMSEPMLRVWMQDWAPPWPSQPQRPGRWIAEASWPSPRITSHRLHLTRVGLAPEANHAEEVTVSSPLTTGIAGGVWCPFTADGDLPIDQGWDDAGALTFDSALLSEPLEILGAVRLVLDLVIDRPNAMLAVRLNDLAPDGTSTRVTYGHLNLAQRTSREWPCPMRPGGREHVSMDLKHVGYRFGAGHRLRLAVSTCYWPIAWPPPHKVMLSIFSPASVLHLPVRSPSAEDVQLAPPLSAEQGGHDAPSNGGRRRSLERDLLSSEIRVITEEGADGGGVALEQIDAIGLQIGSRTLQEYLIKETDPLSAQARIERDVLLRRTDWFIQIEVRMKMRSTPDAFHLDASLRALEDDVEVCCRTWREVIPRDQRDS